MGDAVGKSEVHNFPRNAVVLKPLPYLNIGMCIACHAGYFTVERSERQSITFGGRLNLRQRKPLRTGDGAAEFPSYATRIGIAKLSYPTSSTRTIVEAGGVNLMSQFIIISLRCGIRPTTVIIRWKIAALMCCICQHRLNEALFQQGAEKLGG